MKTQSSKVLATLGLIVALFCLASTTIASNACLYCRRMDINNGFLVNYSYCNQTDECLLDSWNYINRDCLTGWMSGSELTLEGCEAEKFECPGFASTPEKYGKYENITHTIGVGGFCTVKVDAS